MSAFTVWIVAPAGDIHWQCLTEAATAVAYSLEQLGHEVVFNPGNGPYDPRDKKIFGRLVVFNAHRLGETQLPADAIIYNAEQVPVSANGMHVGWQNYLALLRKHVVWDYSQVNLERLKSHGVGRAAYCPSGYTPSLSNIMSVPNQDIDVLFIGSMCDRRSRVLNDMIRRGLVVHTLMGAYGKERNKWIARSKVMLNMHFYDRPIFEIFRVSYYLANGKCVVTEDGGVDSTLEFFAGRSCARVPYDRLVETCAQLASSMTLRKDMEARGRHEIEQLSQVDAVRDALERS